MEKQEVRRSDAKGEAGERGLEGLPMQESPYVKYKDLEDYKHQGYGVEGHLQPQPGRGAGATDAPTLSGSAVSSEAESKIVDAANRQGAL
ncbi:uncharacterized protein LOC129284608 [Prosopis cineraria]|uniref:uncharacterized protein LOC129284608 n=1 Tax=Prosopis cineraria TaxID=364024 RepID=UPI0024102842|nr:uncharacterized protein LOC129284608 [Prosopis cineraria]